eukprot:750180-Hanusia_phi.AAC.9
MSSMLKALRLEELIVRNHEEYFKVRTARQNHFRSSYLQHQDLPVLLSLLCHFLPAGREGLTRGIAQLAHRFAQQGSSETWGERAIDKLKTKLLRRIM